MGHPEFSPNCGQGLIGALGRVEKKVRLFEIKPRSLIGAINWLGEVGVGNCRHLSKEDVILARRENSWVLVSARAGGRAGLVAESAVGVVYPHKFLFPIVIIAILYFPIFLFGALLQVMGK